MTGEPAAATPDRMKVFISYSRDDVNFADQLVLALKDRGFEPLLDRHDIGSGEEWRPRLGGLLLSCDTVVFVLTENSAGSPVCEWEVEEAARLGKRMIPVVPQEIDGVAPPIALAGLNWIHFYSDDKLPGSGFYDGLRKLDQALRVDTDWLRVQTRLSERATEWSRQFNEDLLLRGLALSEAEVWLGRAPAGTAAPPLINEYLTASATAEARRNAEAKARIFEREEALQRAEAAVRDKEIAAARLQATLAEKVRIDRRMRSLSYFSLLLGLVLALGAGAAAWFLSDQHVASAERTSVLYAQAASVLSDEGDNAKAMLMAISGDPLAQRGPIEKGLRPQGYYEGRAALERGYASNRLIRAFPGHTESAGSVVFSEDGALVLTGSLDGDARLFRADTGALIATFDGGDKAGAATAMFSADEKQVVVARSDGEISIWDIANRSVADRRAFFTQDLFGMPVLSADGTHVVAATYQNVVEVWSVADSRRIKTITYEGGQAIRAHAFSPDGQFVLLGMTGAHAEVWSLTGVSNSPVETFNFDDLTNKAVVQIAMSPDMRHVIAATEDGGVFGFEREAPSPFPADILSDSSAAPLALAFSPDGRRLLQMSADGFARVWDLDADVVAARFRVGETGVFGEGSAAFSPDGAQILTGTLGAVQLWRADTGTALAVLNENGGEVNSVAFSPDGSLALTGGADGNARLWDVATGKPAGPVLTGRGDAIHAVAFSPDGKLALTGSDARDVRAGNVRLWNAVTSARGNILSGHNQPVLSVAFSSIGTQTAAGAQDGKVRIWTLNTQASVEFDAHKQAVNSIAFSRDGSRLLTGSSDGTARLWRISDQVLLATYKAGDKVWAAAFSPNEQYVLTGSTGGVAILWPIGGGERVRTYAGHSNNVSSLAFSPDGSLILTGSMDGTAMLWRTDQDRPTAAFTGHTGAVRSVAFSPDGKRVMTGSLDGTAKIWAIDPFLFAVPEEQQRLACEKLSQLGVNRFEEIDFKRFPILTIERPRPCEVEWKTAAQPAVAPANPSPPSPAKQPGPELRPATTAPQP
ncbi:MAG: TIR domain-containing protein [Hyphomonadaceae bacterium]|nr:TIR domain-containing protein [Hyphomonadaceae bacterium]